MEDISRELEREIARAKPSPYKQKRRKRVLIIDDFGEIKPGGYLRKSVRVFFVAAVLFLIAATASFLFLNRLYKENRHMKTQLAVLEKRVRVLVEEKEMLMAKLVISGKDPSLETKPAKKETKAMPGEKNEKQGETATVKSDKPQDEAEPDVGETQQDSFLTPQAVETEPEDEDPGYDEAAGEMGTADETHLSEPKKVAIEKFRVTREHGKGDLMVRFDIRNVSPDPGMVSGRIFTILKPENNSQDQWLVIPHSSLEEGMPSQYRKGQYFSISHFKPVKFRIENPAGPNFFKKAAILIFNEEGSLMFQSDIQIDEESQG